MLEPVRVQAPSRLHFGLASFDNPGGRSFGGAGVMIDTPCLDLRIWRHKPPQRMACTDGNSLRLLANDGLVAPGSAGESTQTMDGSQERIEQTLRRLESAWGLKTQFCAQLLSGPPRHAGLGSGTQLCAAISAGAARLLALWPLDAQALAKWSARGARSAVGLHGFLHGGLIYEDGKLPGESMGRLRKHVNPPDSWRIVLLLSRKEQAGYSGEAESNAFTQAGTVSDAKRAQLLAILENRMIPAAEGGDFDQFASAVGEYGELAGSCFKSVQGGRSYASENIQTVVDTLRQWGYEGVGQSSWGPTIYCFCPNANEAENLQRRLKNEPLTANADCWISSINQGGFRFV